MLEELRLNPRSPAARSRGRCLGAVVDTGGGLVDPNLSTGFAGRAWLRSTGSTSPIHSARTGTVGQKEDVY